MTLNIRMATMDDLNRLMEIFDHARHFMKETGNASQWINGYPQRELIANEIASAHCFVCEKNKNIVGTFCFIQGPDPTYQYIEKGKWLNENPYYVEVLKIMPKVNSLVKTPDGEGKVLYNDLIKKVVAVKFQNESVSEIKVYPVEDLKFDKNI